MPFRKFSRKSAKVSFVSGLLLSFCLLLGVGILGASHAYAVAVTSGVYNCDANAVVAGGATSVSALQEKYNDGASCKTGGVTYSNQAYSIQDVYHAFGMGPSDISAMSSDAVNGYVTKTGDVYVGSTLVATNAYTAGRENIAGSTQEHYGETTFYERTPSVSFLDPAISAMVIMKDGVFQHAILYSCGNPVNATPTTKPTPPPAPKPTPTPYYECSGLTGNIVGDDNEMTRTFVATADYGNGATFTGADFYFGNNESQLNVSPTPGTDTASYTYTYPTAGTYNAKAILLFTVNGKTVTSTACPAVVTPTTPPTPSCKSDTTTGSNDCTPCPTDSSVPVGSSECQTTPQPTLPNTGAGDTIGIFAVVVIAGFLVYRQVVFRKHKAAFVAAERGSSPLPLNDPLDEGKHLHVASAVPKRRSFRGKRPY
jgi:hypothetical protein